MRVLLFLLAAIMFSPRVVVYADVNQARNDYLYQFDLYRQKYTEFQIAKNEYQKFGTLTSQTTALEKTKTMLAQRDQLLHSYLTLLAEKVSEDQGMGESSKQLYLQLIRSELTFLQTHASLIPSIGSLNDASKVSQELEGHYKILSLSIRQILTGLSIGQLRILGNKFDDMLKTSQAIMTTFGGTFSPDKQQTINRWILQINNKKSFYQQKLDQVTAENSAMKSTTVEDLDSQFEKMQQTIAEARQYLLEGGRYMVELKKSLKYIQ